MNFSRRLFLMFALTAVVVTACIGFNFILNPYGAWRIALVNPIFRKVDRDRLVIPYLLRTAEPETILIGSSRVLMGMRIEQGERGGVMNAALTAATINQLSRIVAVALENPRLKRIVWGVDFFAFNPAYDRVDPNFDARIAGNIELKFEDTLLSTAALADCSELARRAMRGARKLRPTMTATVPWPMSLVCEQLGATGDRGLNLTGDSEIEDQLTRDLPDYARYRMSPKLLALFRDTVTAARDRGVEVVMFMPPMSQFELELIRQGGQWETFQNFKRELSAIGPFWDFSGYNGIARSDEFFMHVMHFKIAVGQLLLRIVLGEHIDACNPSAGVIAGSATKVDSSTIENELAMQDRMRAAATRTESRYSRFAAAALARRASSRTADSQDTASSDDATAETAATRTRPR